MKSFNHSLAQNIIDEITGFGGAVVVVGEKIRVWPTEVLTDEIRLAIRSHKDNIVDILKNHNSRTGKPKIETHKSSNQKPDTWPAEIQAAINWLQETTLPKTFTFKRRIGGPPISIIDGSAWRDYLLLSANTGPSSPRARYGAFQSDIMALYEQVRGAQ